MSSRDDSEKAFIKAAKAGDLAGVKKMLSGDRGLMRARDKDGSTALHCAAWKGWVEVVKVLLDHGAKINEPNENGHWGTTPLHAAAHGNQAKVAELLLQRGADATIRNLNGRTPMEETGVHDARAAAKVIRGSAKC